MVKRSDIVERVKRWKERYEHENDFDIIENLSHGSYYVTTQDALGCVVVDSIYLPEPDPLYVNAQQV